MPTQCHRHSIRPILRGHYGLAMGNLVIAYRKAFHTEESSQFPHSQVLHAKCEVGNRYFHGAYLN